MYMPTWPAANAWLIVPQSKRKLLPIELSSHRIALSISSAATVPGLSMVAVVVVARAVLHPAAVAPS